MALPNVSEAAPKPAAAVEAIRVMIVDDSAVIRGLLSRWIEAEAGLILAATAMNGRVAVDTVERAKPHVIIMDIEMPDMDGMTALPLLAKRVPKAQIIMASTLTVRNAEISVRALTLGAADYLAKPQGAGSGEPAELFRRELIAKVRAWGARGLKLAGREAGPMGPAVKTAPIQGAPVLRGFSAVPPRVLAIGSSTGGPQALMEFMKGLKMPLGVPILITQHMPPTFTGILAQHLGRATGRKAQEGQTGLPLEVDQIYVAPGDRHMLIRKEGAQRVIALSDGPPENFCRPAVDPMFRSVAEVFGRETLGVVLTGMGADGREGARAIAAAGGATLAQDEATSVVWGMPGAVAQAGLASAIMALSALAPEANRIIKPR